MDKIISLYTLDSNENEFIIKNNIDNKEYLLNIKETTDENFEEVFSKILNDLSNKDISKYDTKEKIITLSNFNEEQLKPLHREILESFFELISEELLNVSNDINKINKEINIS